jgi:putative methyltransferase (TIGR01177 family)
MDDPKFGEAELELLCDAKQTTKQDDLVCTDELDITQISRLAYVHGVYEILDITKIQDTESFKVSFHSDFSEEERQVWYKQIYQAQQNPKVQMQDQQVTYMIFKIKNKTAVTKQLWVNDKDYKEREPQNRVARHPSMIKAKLAKAMVNVSGIKKGLICDPFCGTGGILLEAAHAQLKVHGSDLDYDMILRAKQNVKDKNVVIQEQDALTLTLKSEAIITDLPYGKNTKDVAPTLYVDFFSHIAKNNLTDTIVTCLPSTINCDKIIDSTQWNITHSISTYIHRSLTRVVYRLTRKRNL